MYALGPGARLGIWTRGCARRCPGCMSPDLRDAGPSHDVPMEALIRSVSVLFTRYDIQGVTISGGEPLDQPDDLETLIRALRPHTSDILLYTGYTQEEIDADPRLFRASSEAGVIVSGPYVAALNDGRPLRGSSNQQLRFRRRELEEKYAPTLAGVREIQVGESGTSVFLIGLLG